MATIKLGSKPKTFKPQTIKVTLPDGTEGDLPVTFKYRTRKEFGEFVDLSLATKKKEEPAVPTVAEAAAAFKADEPFSLAALLGTATDTNAKYLLEIIDSWGLDAPLTYDSLVALGNELPGAAALCMEAYRACCVDGRLGN